jgi:hypothetical protein
MYSPLVRNGAGPGKKVGIVGEWPPGEHAISAPRKADSELRL